jgi:hypothetical protein
MFFRSRYSCEYEKCHSRFLALDAINRLYPQNVFDKAKSLFGDDRYQKFVAEVFKP